MMPAARKMEFGVRSSESGDADLKVDSGGVVVIGSSAMPITRSAAKRMRSDRKRQLRNLQVQSELKTLTKRFLGFAHGENGSQAQEAFRVLVKRLDQAASHGIIHRNTASRKKSRLSRALNKLLHPAQAKK
jgi:small subunit ribosomal protein S20